jgi:plastocyanin
MRIRGSRAAGIAGVMAAVALGAFACSEEDAPDADYVIRVQTNNFFPNDLEVPAGSTIRWVNVLSRSPENRRTVTSGTGPADTTAGVAFDDTLEGYPPGTPEGESVTRLFEDPGTIHYFSRIPPGSEFVGSVTVF